MQSFTSENRRRIVAGSIGILLLFVILFSSFYIAREYDHDCHGHDCPICECIHQCETVIRVLQVGCKMLAAAFFFAILFSSVMHLPKIPARKQTPVSNKVQMNT